MSTIIYDRDLALQQLKYPVYPSYNSEVFDRCCDELKNDVEFAIAAVKINKGVYSRLSKNMQLVPDIAVEYTVNALMLREIDRSLFYNHEFMMKLLVANRHVFMCIHSDCITKELMHYIARNNPSFLYGLYIEKLSDESICNLIKECAYLIYITPWECKWDPCFYCLLKTHRDDPNYNRSSAAMTIYLSEMKTTRTNSMQIVRVDPWFYSFISHKEDMEIQWVAKLSDSIDLEFPQKRWRFNCRQTIRLMRGVIDCFFMF